MTPWPNAEKTYNKLVGVDINRHLSCHRSKDFRPAGYHWLPFCFFHHPGFNTSPVNRGRSFEPHKGLPQPSTLGVGFAVRTLSTLFNTSTIEKHPSLIYCLGSLSFLFFDYHLLLSIFLTIFLIHDLPTILSIEPKFNSG